MSSTHQLTAILFADIEGYTSLMQDDEVNANLLREKMKKSLQQEIDIHHGRILKFSGDGALCIFNSSIEAVRAAIGIQKEMLQQPAVPLRIGIHTGDVMFEETEVHGDGVNIASRIESFAVACGIFISERVYDDIKNQKDIEAVALGKFELKNVSNPVGIFAISNAGLNVPSKEKLQGKGARVEVKKVFYKKIFGGVAVCAFITIAIFLYPKYFQPFASDSKLKSIAILPFANLSASKDDEYFTDGMCDEILTQVSKIGGLNVLSRTSTLQYKDTKKTMKEIGTELGADVLLEGTVQKSGDQVRINVQLINAKKDEHLWAETYDRNLKDIFAIQTDIAKQIASELNTTLSEKEKLLLEEKPTENLQAYDFYLRGNKYARSFWRNSEMKDVPAAVRMYEQAIKLDPKFVDAYCNLIQLYTEISWRKPVMNYEDYLTKAIEWRDKLLALNIDKPVVHYTLGVFKYSGERDYEGALAELDKALKAEPNNSDVYDSRACVLRRLGRIDEAVRDFIKSYELNPKVPTDAGEASTTFLMKRDFDNALKYIDTVITIEPDNANNYVSKATVYLDLKGDTKQALKILNDAAPLVDTSNYYPIKVLLDCFEGNYQHAINALMLYPDSMFILAQSLAVPNSLFIAILYHNDGNNVKANLFFQKAYDKISEQLKMHPTDFRLHESLGVALAGMGEKEKAIAEGTKARDMLPLSKDAILGMTPIENMALIQTLLGNQEEAIDLLGQLIKMPHSWEIGNTIPLYKMHPYWKTLRNNPEFKKMIQS